MTELRFKVIHAITGHHWIETGQHWYVWDTVEELKNGPFFGHKSHATEWADLLNTIHTA
jgi:hypothetical protein